jgi:hypothetical protein
MKFMPTIASILLFFVFALAGCSDSSGGGGGPAGGGNGGSAGDDDASGNGDSGNTAAAVEGYSQKGPFQPGGVALARPLAGDGSPGDGEVTGDIGEQGQYQLGEIDWTGPTEIRMEGTFYNEVSGSFSDGERTLSAVTDLGGEETPSVNVNLFTYFTAERTKTLMAGGEAFADALDE